jgi:hypothetical protein
MARWHPYDRRRMTKFLLKNEACRDGILGLRFVAKHYHVRTFEALWKVIGWGQKRWLLGKAVAGLPGVNPCCSDCAANSKVFKELEQQAKTFGQFVKWLQKNKPEMAKLLVEE